MSWQDQLNGDSLSWLLESDQPGVRYLAMRDLIDLPYQDDDLVAAREKAHQEGPISDVLDQMHPEGYWEVPGPGYNPKYRSSVWAVILLSQLGASSTIDPRIGLACNALIENTLTEHGQLGASGTPSTTADCLQGNLLAAMLDLEFDHPGLDQAFDWMARSVTGEGVAPKEDKKAPVRYYAGKCGPDFLCGANNKKACAWGAIKVLLAFSKLPPESRTPMMAQAIQRGVDFLLGIDPASAEYPTASGGKPSRNWWKFGFPVFYITDLLQNLEALVRLGYGNDPRLNNALDMVREKQDAEGRWPLEYDYAEKTWGYYGEKNQANKWVTLRALRVLKLQHASIEN